ncbi:MAG: hypothetical protein HFI01_04690 [Lachnospiraceae bacterium]|nr:hypothetical protein [Lachnospiraceae bacterium]
MEKKLYLDQIVKETLKKWKLILLITALITFFMGIGGYFSVAAVNDYHYYASIIIDERNHGSEKKDMETMVQRAYKIFTSNKVSDKVHKEYGYELDMIKAISCSANTTSGELSMAMNINKDIWEPEMIKLLEVYLDTAKEMLEENFPAYRIVVVNTPALQSTPNSKQELFDLRIQSIKNYLINGSVMGGMVAVFIAVLCVLWRDNETIS